MEFETILEDYTQVAQQTTQLQCSHLQGTQNELKLSIVLL